MAQDEDKKQKERETMIESAKDLCCEMVGQKDFAFITKIQLAIVVRNLVLDFHKKKDEISKLQNQCVELKNEKDRLQKLIDLTK